LAAITDEKETQDTPTGEATSLSNDPVEDVDLSEAPEHLHKQSQETLRTHAAMWDGTLGTINATEHAIVTPTDAVPIRAQPYRTGLFKRQIIADQINKMLKLKVIEPSHSAWASRVVIVPKKNGKARLCVDYRRRSDTTKKHAYPLPHMVDLLDSLGDAKVFTSFDCTVLLTSKKWRLQREGRPSRRQSVEMKSDWLFDKPRSNYWLRVAVCNLASQSPCLAGVSQSHCNPQ